MSGKVLTHHLPRISIQTERHHTVVSTGVYGGVRCALRTLGEEAMLVHELEGYAVYTHKVKYRLMPWV